MMTEQGTFIINGTERVIVTQLVRSPGAYVMAAKDPTKQVLIANLMPARGSWLEFEIDKRGAVSVRIDRKRKLPATVFLRALAGIDSGRTKDDPGLLSKGTDEEILDLFDGNPFIKATLEKDSVRSVEEALVELFKKQRPGEPPTLEASRNLLWNICFDPKRYDLTRVGRHKLNARLGLEHRSGRPHPHQGRHHRSGHGAGGRAAGHRSRASPRGGPRSGRSGPQPALGRGGQSPGRIRALRQPPPAHGGRAGAGGLPCRSLPHGARGARAHDHRGRRHHHAAVDHQHPAGGRGPQGVLRELAALAVHGPDQLAGRAHPPAAALGPGRGRSHPGARSHRGARRAPHPLRAHVPHRDA